MFFIIVGIGASDYLLKVMMTLSEVMGFFMHTTIDLEDDVLAAARELARMQNVATGRVISRLMREALSRHPSPIKEGGVETKVAAGFCSFASRGVMSSYDIVNELRDREGV
jgi:hypothetical protein